MRGAAISTVLVLFVLPSLLACTSRLRIRAAEAGGLRALTKAFLLEVNSQLLCLTLLAKAKYRIRKEKLLRENECVEDLETRGLLIIQPKKGYRFNSDSVILANLADVSKDDKVYDLGCGSGVMSLLVAAKKGATVVGVELQDALASMAERSVKANDYQQKVTIIKGDVRDAETLFPAGDADAIIINPPYFKAGSGEVSHDEMQAIARHEITLTLPEELAAARHLLKQTGKAFFLFPTSREKEFDKAVQESGLFLCEKIYLTSSTDKTPDSFIAKITKTPLEQTTRVLVTKDEEGKMSKEVAALYRS